MTGLSVKRMGHVSIFINSVNCKERPFHLTLKAINSQNVFYNTKPSILIVTIATEVVINEYSGY